MLDDDHGHAKTAVDVGEGLEDHARAHRIEGCRGLVQHEHAWLEREDGGNCHLLLLAARERGDFALAQVGDAYRGKTLDRVFLDLVVGDAEVLEAEKQLIFHHGGDHLRVDVLCDGADETRDIGKCDIAGILARDEGAAEELAGEVVGDGARQACGEGRPCLRRRGR